MGGRSSLASSMRGAPRSCSMTCAIPSASSAASATGSFAAPVSPRPSSTGSGSSTARSTEWSRPSTGCAPRSAESRATSRRAPSIWSPSPATPFDGTRAPLRSAVSRSPLRRSPTTPRSWGPPTSFGRLVDNLVSNAIRHAPHGTGVTVSHRGRRPECHAAGRRPRSGHRPCEPTRPCSSVNPDPRATHGWGIGLGIAGEIAARHNGRIALDVGFAGSVVPGRAARDGTHERGRVTTPATIIVEQGVVEPLGGCPPNLVVVARRRRAVVPARAGCGRHSIRRRCWTPWRRCRDPQSYLPATPPPIPVGAASWTSPRSSGSSCGACPTASTWPR